MIPNNHLLSKICAYEYLDANYPLIIKHMLYDEFYIIQDEFYDVFYEITYENVVVGFIAGMFVENDTVLVCELCYILPEYRGRGLFCSALTALDDLFDVHVWINLPNNFAIQSLINNNLALKLNRKLVLSKYPLSFTIENTLYHSRLYDLEYCCITDLHNQKVSTLLDVDAYTCNPQRDISDLYFTVTKSQLLRSINGSI